MADDKRPAKKVVKRVVKKAVATPASPRTAAPQVRYGRTVTTAPRPRQGCSQPRPRPASQGASSQDRGRVQGQGRPEGRDVAGRAPHPASPVRSGPASSRVGDGDRRQLLPHSAPGACRTGSPIPASVFTGAVVGLIAVGLGLASKSLFNELRGVSAGGGRWGSLTFVVVAFIAFVLGELLLSGFGVAQARLTSFLGVVLTIVAMLGLFLGLADTVWGLLIVPAVASSRTCWPSGCSTLPRPQARMSTSHTFMHRLRLVAAAHA